MAKFRRGVNCVTPELYAELKSKLNCPADDNKVMREYKISASTCRSIRNTNSYDEYRDRVANKRKAMRNLESIVENATYDREPKVTITTEVERPETSLGARIVGLFLLACLLLIAGSLTYAALKWAFGF